MPTLSFKVTTEQARSIRERARAQRSSVSHYLRKSALGETTARRHDVVIKEHPVSGLPYDAGGSCQTVVTRDQIRALLADFP
jgi:hypothetical protein